MQTSSSKLYFAPNDQSLSAKSLPGDTFCLFELKFVLPKCSLFLHPCHTERTEVRPSEGRLTKLVRSTADQRFCYCIVCLFLKKVWSL